MFASQETGWSSNDNMYSTATSLSGPWSAWKVSKLIHGGCYSELTESRTIARLSLQRVPTHSIHKQRMLPKLAVTSCTWVVRLL